MKIILRLLFSAVFILPLAILLLLSGRKLPPLAVRRRGRRS